MHRDVPDMLMVTIIPQILGGTLNSAFMGFGVMYNHSIMMPIALQLETWPSYEPFPHLDTPTTLKDYPLPVDSISTLLPSETYTKFFRQAFWQTEHAKYGYRALNLKPDNGALTVLNRRFLRMKDLIRVFGRTHGNWLLEALRFMKKLGHGLLHAYCSELMGEKMEFVWVRKRFHQECKVWKVRTRAFDKVLDKINSGRAELSAIWQAIHLPEADKLAKIANHNQLYQEALSRGENPVGGQLDWHTYHFRLRVQFSNAFNSLIMSHRDMHHHLLHEIRCIQTMVVDYVQQALSNRQTLHDRYVGPLYRIIEEDLEPSVQDTISTLDRLRTDLNASGSLSAEDDDTIQRIRTFLQLDLNHLAKSKFFLSEDNVVVDNLLWEGELETIPRGRAKKKSQTMKRMATKELCRAPPVVRRLVDKFLDIIEINKDEARKEDAARTRDGLMDAIKRDMKPVEPRKRGQKGGKPFWLLPTPTESPEPTGAMFARPGAGRDVRPWQAGKCFSLHLLPHCLTACVRGLLTAPITSPSPSPAGTGPPLRAAQRHR